MEVNGYRQLELSFYPSLWEPKHDIFKNIFLIEDLWNQVKIVQVVIRFAKVINLIVQC